MSGPGDASAEGQDYDDAMTKTDGQYEGDAEPEKTEKEDDKEVEKDLKSEDSTEGGPAPDQPRGMDVGAYADDWDPGAESDIVGTLSTGESADAWVYEPVSADTVNAEEAEETIQHSQDEATSSQDKMMQRQDELDNTWDRDSPIGDTPDAAVPEPADPSFDALDGALGDEETMDGLVDPQVSDPSMFAIDQTLDAGLIQGCAVEPLGAHPTAEIAEQDAEAFAAEEADEAGGAPPVPMAEAALGG